MENERIGHSPIHDITIANFGNIKNTTIRGRISRGSGDWEIPLEF
jgi:hypothetical protein